MGISILSVRGRTDQSRTGTGKTPKGDQRIDGKMRGGKEEEETVEQRSTEREREREMSLPQG